MRGRTNGAVLTLALTIGMVQPSAEQQRFEPSAEQQRLDVPLGPTGQNSSGPKLSFGSVGLNSQAGDSYVPGHGDNPYYYNVPSKRPVPKVPGVLIHIPLGRGDSHQ